MNKNHEIHKYFNLMKISTRTVSNNFQQSNANALLQGKGIGIPILHMWGGWHSTSLESNSKMLA